MKRILCLVFLSVSLVLSAQERVDTLYFLNGDIEGVLITVNHEDKLEFVYPGETMLNIIGKDKLAKIVFRSGRVKTIDHAAMQAAAHAATAATQPATAQTVAAMNPDLARMERLKTTTVYGDKTKLNDPAGIQVSLKLSDELNSLVNTADFDWKAFYLKEFVESLGQGSFYQIDSVESVKAEVLLLTADSDGEVYGIMDYMLPDENEPVYSIYLNGNGSRKGESFEEKLLGGVRHAAENAINYIYKPLPEKEKRIINLKDRAAELTVQIDNLKEELKKYPKKSDEYNAVKKQLDDLKYEYDAVYRELYYKGVYY